MVTMSMSTLGAVAVLVSSLKAVLGRTETRRSIGTAPEELLLDKEMRETSN